jgi:uncharacterized protein (DUF488 family)
MKQGRVLDAVDPSLFEGKVVLLCSEAEADKCHRRLVAEMLAQHWSSQGYVVEVRHLQSAKRRPRKKAALSRGERVDRAWRFHQRARAG